MRRNGLRTLPAAWLPTQPDSFPLGVKPYGVKQVELPVMDELQNQLAEERVLPCEPCAGEVLRIVLVEGLVHESGSRVGVEQSHDAVPDFIVVRRGERPHHYAHRPDHVISDVRSADSLARSALEEVGVAVAQDETARVAVGRVVRSDVAEIGKR